MGGSRTGMGPRAMDRKVRLFAARCLNQKQIRNIKRSALLQIGAKWPWWLLTPLHSKIKTSKQLKSNYDASERILDSWGLWNTITDLAGEIAADFSQTCNLRYNISFLSLLLNIDTILTLYEALSLLARSTSLFPCGLTLSQAVNELIQDSPLFDLLNVDSRHFRTP